MAIFSQPSLSHSQLRDAFIGCNTMMEALLYNRIKLPYGNKLEKVLSAVADERAKSLDELKHMFSIVRKKKIDKKYDWGKIMNCSEDILEDQMIEMFPFRTKDDKKLRNIRFLDVRRFLNTLSANRTNIISQAISTSSGDLDYIFVCNFCLYMGIVSETVLFFWQNTSLLSTGTWAFVDKVKELSDYIKSHKKGDYYWQHLVELNCLAGYKNPPVPDFDLTKNSKELADGNNEKHHFIYNYPKYVKKHLTGQHKYHVDYTPFKQFIAEGKWATSGASSMGKLDLLDIETGKVKKIKCRKNFVLDVEEVDILYKVAISATTQINYTLLKCELGKIRLAVASDLGSYLCASYMVHHCGGCYLNWPGVTLEEKTNARIKRMMDIRGRLTNSVGVPFDFASFDHQLLTDEIVEIVRVVVDSARQIANVDPDFETVAFNVIDSFYHSSLLTRIDDQIEIWDVISGLMSGHRMTSIIGNGYNSVATGMVIDGMVELSEKRTDFYYNVQGDDTNILCRTKRQGLMCLRLYQIMNMKFGRGKFSIQPQNTEYLRVWHDDKRTYSYMTRTLPNLLQRKPWSNEPWDPAGVMRGIWDKIGILKRRDCDSDSCDMLWSILSKRWCELNHLPLEALSVPANLGGLGVSVWDGKTAISPPIPTMKKLGFQAIGKTGFRVDKLRLQAQELHIDREIDYNKMADDQLNGVVSSDDVPAASIISRRLWRSLLASNQYRVIEYKSRISIKESALQTFYWYPFSGESWSNQTKWLKDLTQLYGSFKREAEEVTAISQFNRYNLGEKIGIGEWIRNNRPYFYRALRRLRVNGGMQNAIDYLGGNINLNENVINNDVKEMYTRYCMKNLVSTQGRMNIKAYYSMMRTQFINGFSNCEAYQYCFAHI
jgi:hypothetical protein